jgi:hypothetical protein
MAYLPLSTANLPDPVIDPAQGSSPEDYFGTLLFTATAGVAGSVTGLGFAPDFSWTKARNAAQSHQLFDNVRGDGVRLITNSTGAESDLGATYVSLEDDGIDYGSSTFTSNTYVAWNWKANGSGVSNTDGSITSSVSANTTSGFSIVTYTGTGATSSGVTIGHGLGATPAMIITKCRDTPVVAGGDYWSTWHKDLGGNYGIWLNLTNGRNSGMWDGYTNIDADVFSPPDLNYGNSTGKRYVNYVFAEVEGFSKFGSYTGNGSADGPFVYTGFRPAFVVVKATSVSGENWNIIDNERDDFNDGNTNLLYANLSNSEGTSSPHYFDLLSNGMKLSGNIGNWNSSGVTYIYMAFAENPFKYSNAR